MVLKKEQQKMEQTIQESLGKQTNLHSLLQEMVQHEQEDRAGLDEVWSNITYYGNKLY